MNEIKCMSREYILENNFDFSRFVYRKIIYYFETAINTDSFTS